GRGDLSLSNAGAFTVTKINGKAVSSNTPTANQVLTWNNGTSTWESATTPLPTLTSANLWVGNGSNAATAVTAGGDVSMTNAGSFTVAKFQGRSLASNTPLGGQVLGWNSGASIWEPMSTAVGSVTSIIAGPGLLGGTLTS